MPVHALSHVVSLPLSPAGSFHGRRENFTRTGPDRVSMQVKSFHHSASCLSGSRLRNVEPRRFLTLFQKQPASSICVAGLQATCKASGQTQTITREAPTITRAPTHSKDKSPQLYDGGTGFPPRDHGGGGGGGGGFNSSGGFYLFGFLLLMSHLKDLEGDQGGSTM